MKILQTLKLLAKPGERLSQRVFHAGFWMATTRVGVRALGIVRIIVLARLLAPEDFGLMGIALLVVALVESFTQVGFHTALVQRKGDIRSYLDTAWTVQFMRQLLLGGILFASGPWIATFFNNPAARPIVQVMGGALALRGLTNVGLVYFLKELEFHKQFVYELGTTIADLGVAIPAALILRNAWALVFGALASYGVGVVISYLIHPYRPRLSFNLQKAKDLLGFGKWIYLAHVCQSLFRRADSFVIGKFLGTPALGFYQIAQRVSSEPFEEVKTTTDSVAFPTYSKVQDNLPVLRQAFLRATGLAAAIVLPLAVVILFLAPDFTRLVLGEKWMPAVTTMQVLGFAGAIRAIIATSGSLYMGMGRPNLNFHYILLRGAVTLAIIYPLTKIFGISGAALSLLLANLVILPIYIWYPANLLKIKIAQLGKALAPSIVISLVVAAGILVAKQVAGQVDLMRFIIIIAVTCILYLSLSFYLWRWFRSGPLAIMSTLRS